MGGAGPVRQAARQVSAYREIFFASVAGIAVSYGIFFFPDCVAQCAGCLR